MPSAMMRRPYRRRSRRGLWPLINRLVYIHPQKQYILMMSSAILMAALIFSGILLFRQSDQGDLMRRGQWLMKQGKVALAAGQFERLVHLNPKSYRGHLALGNAYMEINEPEKAAREFRIASQLRAGNLRESGAHVAISRLMIVQGKYQDAEKQLQQAYQAQEKNRKDPDLLAAMVELYETWGDSFLDSKPPNYEQAFLKYANALRYVKSVDEQQPVEQKLVKAASFLSDQYVSNKQFDKAIAVLRYALHFENTADNNVAIAWVYEQKDDLDNAIIWYRKAYQLDPKGISLKLASMLVRKGRELMDAHQPKDAERYFGEAQTINETVKLPSDALFPVKANDLVLSYTVNPVSFDLVPQVEFSIANGGSYPINYLTVRVLFLTGDEKLADLQQIAATRSDPLGARGEFKGSKALEFKAPTSIPLEDLEHGKLKVKIMVSYQPANSASTRWFDVTTSEIAVPEAQHIEDVRRS